MSRRHEIGCVTYPGGMESSSPRRETETHAAHPGPRRGAPGPEARASMPSPAPMETEEPDTEGGVDEPWLTIVWDDPVNLMSYVTFVLQRIFGYSREKAQELMLKVHNEGRAVVASGSRDKVENDVRKLHEAGLWASMEKEL